MDERWEKIQAVFHEALEHPASEQRVFVEAACGDDRELTAQVLAMLEEHNRNASVLDRGLPGFASQMVDSPDVGIPFERFGPYRIKRRLGEGGMGVVYLAEREDLGNLVAIKILRDAALSPARRERFTSEQKLLAQLNHPYIARLYDADTLPDGTPWFAMEYVEGLHLTEYCRTRQCSVQERLHLFQSVCEAVKYAHDHAIIHRDLKPSNILVKEDGTPRLLDFGIAKQMESLSDREEQTRTGMRLMTPAYASPEQVRNENVGVYTDVYSLGVILYEMLTGRLPFDLSKSTPAEAERLITQQEPEKPSVAASRSNDAAKASRAAWTDLDVLCLTAMHKDAERRYRSVEALIRDIDHYLAGEPLEARPDSVPYKVGKFVKRNWRPLAAAGLVFAAVIGLVVFFTVRLTKARDAALAEAARSQRLGELLQKVFRGGDEEVGPSQDLRVLTLVDRGAKDAELLTDDPKVQADLFQTLGTEYQSLGKLDRAESLLQRALKLRRSIYGPDHAEIADTLTLIGALRLEQDRLPEAERLVRDAIAMGKRHLPPDHPRVISAILLLGNLLQKRDANDEAITIVGEAVRNLSKQDPPTKNYSASLTLLANVYFSKGDYPRAESLNQQALAIDRRLYGEHHPDLADDYINLGSLQVKWGHSAKAEKYFRQALEIESAWYGKDSAQVADALGYVAQALWSQSRFPEAEALLKQALLTTERVFGKVHHRVALILGTLGAIAKDVGNLDEAEAYHSREAAIYKSVYGDNHPHTLNALSNLAADYRANKEYARAEALLKDLIQRFELAKSERSNIAVARLRLGDLYFAEERYRDAEREMLTAYEILSQGDPSVDWLRTAREQLVKVYTTLNEPEKAAKFRAELAAQK